MYSKTPPDAVHATLKKFNASYIILEDSICLALDNECGLPVQLDVDMGIVCIVKHVKYSTVCEVPYWGTHPSKIFKNITTSDNWHKIASNITNFTII